MKHTHGKAKTSKYKRLFFMHKKKTLISKMQLERQDESRILVYVLSGLNNVGVLKQLNCQSYLLYGTVDDANNFLLP